jgi:drug/metabolite transporter (DMT)-like permease
VYFVWGCTFYAIRVGVETIPPHLLAGLRYLIAGLFLYPAFRIVTGEKPTLAQWRLVAHPTGQNLPSEIG